MSQTERDRQRDRPKRATPRQRQTDGQTDRQRRRQKDTQIETERTRQTKRTEKGGRHDSRRDSERNTWTFVGSRLIFVYKLRLLCTLIRLIRARGWTFLRRIRLVAQNDIRAKKIHRQRPGIIDHFTSSAASDLNCLPN